MLRQVERVVPVKAFAIVALLTAACMAPAEPATPEEAAELAERQERRRRVGLAIANGLVCTDGSCNTTPRPQTAVQQQEPMQVAPARNHGCINDIGCPAGQACIIPQYETHGTCMKAVNQYGAPTYTPPSVHRRPPECRFDYDCPLSFKCQKGFGALEGHCVK